MTDMTDTEEPDLINQEYIHVSELISLLIKINNWYQSFKQEVNFERGKLFDIGKTKGLFQNTFENSTAKENLTKSHEVMNPFPVKSM